MGERPRVFGGQEHKRPVRLDKPRPGNCMPNARSARAERGVALITVLIAVSFVSIIVIACITMVTMAARTTSWSLERTKALYAAEAGINHWLFEASIQESGAPHQHGRRHGDGRADRGYGHTHGAGHGGAPGSGQGGAQGPSEIETIEVSGEVNGIPYVASVAAPAGTAAYRIVSTAEGSSRSTVVSVEAGMVAEAWRHVVYASSTPGWIDSKLRGFLGLFGIPVYDMSGVSPAPGQLYGPVLFPWEDRNSYPPNLGDRNAGWESYRSAVAPAIAQWNPPRPPQKVTLDVLRPVGTGPFYYKDSTIGTIEGPVNGDLYLENCVVETISGPVNGGIFVKTGRNGSVTRIVGTIAGSICIDSSQRELNKEGYRSTAIGDPSARCVVGGSVYLRGRVEKQWFFWRNWDAKPDVLAIYGPSTATSEPTQIAGGVFSEDASVYVEGNTYVSRKSGTAWPAVLSNGSVVLNGGRGPVRVSGLVYSEAAVSGSLGNLVVSALVGTGFPEAFAHAIGALTAFVSDSLGLDFGLIVAGEPSGEDRASVTVSGNLVTPGIPLLLGKLVANYDRSLLQQGNQPLYFEGGRQVLAPIRGTWTAARN
ncbi:MAG TPA: hypothetical protein GX515_09910 [Firmicutes bacterium]|nr:hypothetical protein [Bacillota bacterium]